MADIYTASNVYQGTFELGTVETTPLFQICATADISAANQFECTFWLNKNGLRQDSDLGDASFRIRDKTGAQLSGMEETGITPDSNGYFRVTPLLANLIFDLNHYLLEIEIPYEGVEKAATIGLVNGE